MIKVFSKKWFEKYNKQICWLANSFLGQFIFKFRKYGHYTENKIVKMTPNSVGELLGVKKGRVKIREHFFSRNEYALRLQKVFYPVWLTFHIWDIITRPIPQLNLGFDTLTVYPDANPESTSVDGQVSRTGVNETFASIRAGAGDYSDDIGATVQVMLYCSATTDQFSENDRVLTFYDTSALGSTITISSAVESVYGQIIRNNIPGTAFDLHIAQGNAASNTALVDADYNQANHGETSFGAISNASLSTASYNDITLNATGITSISKTGITKHSWQTSWDINNNFTGTWSGGNNSGLVFNNADIASNKPKLVVTYTVSATDNSIFFGCNL